MQQPPLLPEETLARVTRLGRLDGMCVLVLAAVFALMAASRGETPFAIIGLLAAGAGALELHGASLLQQGRLRGMRWVVLSQPLLLAVILGYCGLRLSHFEMPPIPERLQEAFAVGAQQAGLTVEEYARTLNRISVQLLALAAVLYQGGMTLYYLRRRRAVEQALGE